MDVTATRLANLQALVLDKLADSGTKKQVAQELDMSASFLSQLLAGKKMGDDVARKIEAAARLSRGWLDVPHGPRIADGSEPVYGGSHALGMDAEILGASIRLVRLACQSLEVEFNPEDDAVLIVHGYRYLDIRREREVTLDNLVDFTKRLRELRKETGDDEPRGTSTGSASTGASRESPRRKTREA